MAFISVTETGKAIGPIYINVDHIIAVEHSTEEYARIVTSGEARTGGSRKYVVNEPVPRIWEKIEEAT